MMRCLNRLAIVMAWATVALFAAPALAAGGEGDGDPGSKLLTPDVKSALFNLAMFICLLAVLGKFVWPVILKGLQDREQKIAGDLTAAEQARADADKLKAEFDAKLADAQAESRKMLDDARADAEQLRAKLKADTEAEMANLRQRAADDIDRAKQAALQEIYATSAELATAVASKILQRQVDDSDTQRLVEQSLAELQNKAG